MHQVLERLLAAADDREDDLPDRIVGLTERGVGVRMCEGASTAARARQEAGTLGG
ncbi:MAG: hypothetical protein HOV87_12605 [Catenulispora sp.]|nr:hypothetical protein [Catenulispora sp.]